jgi:phosphoribosylaminoimidazolecarboxamide formyltransferase / IMP cyclohydrolase
MTKPIALVSVSDKTNLIPFSKKLIKLGFKIISTGGTAKLLSKNKIPVIQISTLTEFPEILNGRVKTLHPKIFGGILAQENKKDLDELQKLDIQPIDLVCVNLYPFSKTIKQKNCVLKKAIEQIDIGGVTLLRAAAKNFERVTVVSSPDQYSIVAEKLTQKKMDLTERKNLAAAVFAKTQQYDVLIANFLQGKNYQLPNFVTQKRLRYGENPHQNAILMRENKNNFSNIANANVLQGKELSFNNLVDADFAFRIVQDFSAPTVAVIKHANPCGIASAPKIELALKNALSADKKSPFGGIVALNKNVNRSCAEIIKSFFIEVIVAPSFTTEAKKIFQTKKNLRLLAIEDFQKKEKRELEFKKIGGGLLIQDQDSRVITMQDLKIVTKKPPTKIQIQNLIFAANCCKHAKSNAIVLAKNLITVGIGAGQTARVDAVEIALAKAGTRAVNSVLASDAFFPFADSVEVAARAGVVAIIQSGGSIRDAEVITAADAANLVMVFSGVRGFRH